MFEIFDIIRAHLNIIRKKSICKIILFDFIILKIVDSQLEVIFETFSVTHIHRTALWYRIIQFKTLVNDIMFQVIWVTGQSCRVRVFRRLVRHMKYFPPLLFLIILKRSLWFSVLHRHFKGKHLLCFLIIMFTDINLIG